MRRRHAKLVILAVGMFIGIFSSKLMHAEDMSIWKDKWFKINMKYNGYFSLVRLAPDTGVRVYYLKILGTKLASEPDAGLKCDFYYYEDEEWWGVALDLNHFCNPGDEECGISALDFICWPYVEELWQLGYMQFGFIARIRGKTRNGVLTSATLKSPGGYYFNLMYAGGFTLTGSLIPESK